VLLLLEAAAAARVLLLDSLAAVAAWQAEHGCRPGLLLLLLPLLLLPLLLLFLLLLLHGCGLTVSSCCWGQQPAHSSAPAGASAAAHTADCCAVSTSWRLVSGVVRAGSPLLCTCQTTGQLLGVLPCC
jgi:hypothetical protein